MYIYIYIYICVCAHIYCVGLQVSLEGHAAGSVRREGQGEPCAIRPAVHPPLCQETANVRNVNLEKSTQTLELYMCKEHREVQISHDSRI